MMPKKAKNQALEDITQHLKELRKEEKRKGKYGSNYITSTRLKRMEIEKLNRLLNLEGYELR